jgi:hypothetical protein
MQESVEDGGGEDGVVVEDLGPGFVGLVGGEDDGTAFVALADDLEEEVGAGFVDREISQFVDDEQRRAEELLEFLGQAVGDLGRGESVDDLDGGDEAHGVSGGTGGVAQGGGDMGFAESDAAEKDHVGLGFDEAQAEEVLDLGAVDFPGPAPLELFEGFEGGKARGLETALERGLVAPNALGVNETGEVVEVGPGVASGLGGEGGVLLGDGLEVEGLELLFEALLVRFHGAEGGSES